MKNARFLSLLLPALLLAGCAWFAAGEDATPFKTTVWQLETLYGSDNAPLVGQRRADFFIEPTTGRAVGFAGVNNFTTAVKIDTEKRTLRFERPISTLKAGPNLAFEGQYLKVFPQAESYTISGGKLILYNAAGAPLAEFIAAPPGSGQRVPAQP